jgi:hypothetical protein
MGAMTLSIMTVSIMTVSIMTVSIMTVSMMTVSINSLYVTLSIHDTQHNVEYCYADCTLSSESM